MQYKGDYSTINEIELSDNKSSLEEAGAVIRDGGLVAFPTETVYGLGGDALNPQAARRIYEAKGRPSDNPLIVHICELQALWRIAVDVPQMAFALAKEFWPGPLTMIFKASDVVPRATTGGLSTVAVRMPDHPVALGFIREAGGFVAAPSANTSGRPSPTTADHVREDLGERVDMILDGGAAAYGLESTIVDMTGDRPLILRPGYITAEDVASVIGVEVGYDPAIMNIPGIGIGVLDLAESYNTNNTIDGSSEAALTDNSDNEIGLAPKAPGMKYRHYAPKGEMYLVSGDDISVTKRIVELSLENTSKGKKVGVLCASESVSEYDSAGIGCKVLGSRQDVKAVAASLYGALRELDAEGADIIYSECFTEKGLGIAVMNRLIKAAGGKIICAG